MTTPAEPAGTSERGSHAQTLSRGIHALEILADSARPLTIAELAVALGVHRSIAYRILRTLEEHGLVVRDSGGRLSLGPRVASLARGVARDLQSAALPELTAVANELEMTAFLVVLDGRECVTLVSVEPRHSVVAVAQRPGTRHSLAIGAPGIAIQSRLSPDAAEPASSVVAEAREHGYATSHDEVIPGVSSVAVAIDVPHATPAAIAVVSVSTTHSNAEIAARLTEAASAVRDELR